MRPEPGLEETKPLRPPDQTGGGGRHDSGHRSVSKWTMNSSGHQSVLEDIYESTCLTADDWLKLDHVTGNDPKHSSRSTSEWKKNKRIQVLERSSQSPDVSECLEFLKK